MKKKPKIFISHTKKDKPFVRQLVSMLKKDGIDTWFDEVEIKIGESIHQKVNEGLKQSDFFAVVLSKSSIQSKWVQEELSSASSMEKYNSSGIYVLPIQIEECDIPPLLLDRRYANFKDDPDSAYQELVDAIYHHFKNRHPGIDISTIRFQELNKNVIIEIVKNKEKIFDISPRQLEEVISAFFQIIGYEIQMAPITKDGGYDIVAVKEIAPGLSLEKFIVKCKRYSKPVGIDVVHRLAGAQEVSGANRAILVTTSYFTKAAQNEAQKLHLDLIDIDTLHTWLSKTLNDDINFSPRRE